MPLLDWSDTANTTPFLWKRRENPELTYRVDDQIHETIYPDLRIRASESRSSLLFVLNTSNQHPGCKQTKILNTDWSPDWLLVKGKTTTTTTTQETQFKAFTFGFRFVSDSNLILILSSLPQHKVFSSFNIVFFFYWDLQRVRCSRLTGVADQLVTVKQKCGRLAFQDTDKQGNKHWLFHLWIGVVISRSLCIAIIRYFLPMKAKNKYTIQFHLV